MRMLALTLIVAVVGLASGAHNAARSGLVGVAYFRETTTVLSHNGAFPGSTQAWRSSVILLHAPKHVGTGGIACVYTTNKVRECFGTYALPQGRIKVLGELSNRSSFSLAIIGGTGVYEKASGVAKFSPGLVTFYFD